MRVLVDQNSPRGLRTHLPDHEVVLAREMGWATLANGELIAAAETASFDVLVTADQNIQYQQNLSGRRLALVVLGTNHWDVIRAEIHLVQEALSVATAGTYASVSFTRPPLRRRPYSPSVEC
jgi:hypothetical protein